MDSQRQTVEVYRRKGDLWGIYSYGPADQVELASLSVSFPVAALYENVTLPEDIEE